MLSNNNGSVGYTREQQQRKRIWRVRYEYVYGRYLGTILNGGDRRHGRDAGHIEKNYGVEG